MKKLKYNSHELHLDWLKEFYQNNKEYMSETMIDVFLDAIDCMEYTIVETNDKTKTEIEFNNTTLNVGNTIFIYEPNTDEIFNPVIGEIVITKSGVTLNDINRYTICPMCKLDSNEKWGSCLYFSSYEKRQEYISNYKENK